MTTKIKRLKPGRPKTGITQRPVSVRVSQSQFERLHRYCDANNTGTSRVIQALIDKHLPK